MQGVVSPAGEIMRRSSVFSVGSLSDRLGATTTAGKAKKGMVLPFEPLFIASGLLEWKGSLEQPNSDNPDTITSSFFSIMVQVWAVGVQTSVVPKVPSSPLVVLAMR